MPDIEIKVNGRPVATMSTDEPTKITVGITEDDLRNGTVVTITVPPATPPSKIDGEELPR